jgi:hypothetical protein
MEEVLEEKLMFKIMNFSASRFLKQAWTVTVLAAPESPQKRAGF